MKVAEPIKLLARSKMQEVKNSMKTTLQCFSASLEKDSVFQFQICFPVVSSIFICQLHIYIHFIYVIVAIKLFKHIRVTTSCHKAIIFYIFIYSEDIVRMHSFKRLLSFRSQIIAQYLLIFWDKAVSGYQLEELEFLKGWI